MKALKHSILGAVAGLTALAGAIGASPAAAQVSVGVGVGVPGPGYWASGGRNYCWYAGGWHGPGFYRCGFAWRRGWGWGGPAGWNGWYNGRPYGWRRGDWGHDRGWHRGWDHNRGRDGRWGHDRGEHRGWNH